MNFEQLSKKLSETEFVSLGPKELEANPELARQIIGSEPGQATSGTKRIHPYAELRAEILEIKKRLDALEGLSQGAEKLARWRKEVQ